MQQISSLMTPFWEQFPSAINQSQKEAKGALKKSSSSNNKRQSLKIEWARNEHQLSALNVFHLMHSHANGKLDKRKMDLSCQYPCNFSTFQDFPSFTVALKITGSFFGAIFWIMWGFFPTLRLRTQSRYDEDGSNNDLGWIIFSRSALLV